MPKWISMNLTNKHHLLFTICILWLLGSCNKDSKQFNLLSAEESGITFNNIITENDSMNILDYEYLYNGGGVGIGDFNNDGWEDIYFTGNMVGNQLYLNDGGLKFRDITEVSQSSIDDKWSSGIAILDINGDGWDDIYVCHNTLEDSTLRENTLLINQGLNADGIPTFADKAEAYGLNDNSYSVNSAFFDYDNDGDLDVMVIINEMQETRFPSKYHQKKKKRKSSYQRIDKLFRNDYDTEKGHPVYTDVSDEAGISIAGFSLGINITDINQDGWKDIYITNDFLSNDILYINQKNGTFSDEAKTYFKHTSFSAMGNDVVDINNDGLSDIIALDMLPENNYRQKKLLGPNNYNSYLSNDRYGYMYQFVRNTLQLNNGMGPEGDPLAFSDISLKAGLSATDWSWTPLVADFNNDLYRDIIITNGFPKDVTDMDFIEYKASNFTYAPKSMMISKIPSIKAKNCAYVNNGDLTFTDCTDNWGLEEKTFSNGAAYADFDKDGDLDIIINNIDNVAFLYENQASSEPNSKHFIQCKLTEGGSTTAAIGASIRIQLKDQVLSYEYTPYRGYLSSYSPWIHFGLDTLTVIPEITVTWKDGTQNKWTDVAVDQQLELSKESSSVKAVNNALNPSLVSMDAAFKHMHTEIDYIDYNIQPLLPFKFSQDGPSLSVGDVNGDSIEDIYVSGAAFFRGYFLMGQEDGSYDVDTFYNTPVNMEELASLLFDADGDGDNDLIICGGSYEYAVGDSLLKNRFFENESGRFIYRENALPGDAESTSCIKGADYDQDGDLDLFIGTRVAQDSFPLPMASYILENTSSNGGIRFQDVTSEIAPELLKAGMVTDALWSDVNMDGKVDLIVTSLFSPVQVYHNDGDRLSRQPLGDIENYNGFWNSVSGGDLDGDGDIDYVLGNRGENLFHQINDERPYKVYVKDFDNNGSIDALPFTYFKDTLGEFIEYPFMSRLDFAKEINSIRKKYPSYEKYAVADVHTLITDTTMQKTDVYEVNYTSSAILWNEDGKWRMERLPTTAQLSPTYGTIITDINQDGNKDIVLVGNDYGNEIFYGRLDAGNGSVLINQGNSEFTPMPTNQSGFYVPGDAKALVKSTSKNNHALVSSENRSYLRKHDINTRVRIIRPELDDAYLSYEIDGSVHVEEIYYGSSFLSQSSRRIAIPIDAIKVTLKKFNGEERVLSENKNTDS